MKATKKKVDDVSKCVQKGGCRSLPSLGEGAGV